MARTAITYPRLPLGGIFQKETRIEGTTGDVASTAADGWLESEKFNWWLYRFGGTWSCEFDTAVTRTGTRTLLIQATDATGRGAVYNSIANGVTVARLYKHCVHVLPLTSYTLNCYVKTTDAAASSVFVFTNQYNAAGTKGTVTSSNKLTGTNDWTLCTLTHTTDADARFLEIGLIINVASATLQSAWFDVNSMILIKN